MLHSYYISLVLKAKESNIHLSSVQKQAGSIELRRLVQIWDQLVIKDGLLFRKYLNNQKQDVHYQMVIPKAMRMEVLEELHGRISGGHLGEDKTLQKLKQRFYWPGHWQS